VGYSVLLDTNAFLWLAGNISKQKNIGPKARRLIEAADFVYVSSITVAEIEVKKVVGKLSINMDIVDMIIDSGLVELSFSASNAKVIGSLQSLQNHDPFDRIILSQAIDNNLRLLTSDQILLDLGLNNVVDVSI
jgi:PIN domain nuclease of toxin-antitoxin system